MSDTLFRAIGSHQSSRATTHEWITPKWIIDALGPFDLDPCAAKVMPWRTADKMLTIDDDGYAAIWGGVVWMNPPYGSHANDWLRKLAQYGDGIALIPARTETKYFQNWVFPFADGLLFVKGRITFCDTSGRPGISNSGAPSVLIAYGEECNKRLQSCGIEGKYINLSK